MSGATVWKRLYIITRRWKILQFVLIFDIIRYGVPAEDKAREEGIRKKNGLLRKGRRRGYGGWCECRGGERELTGNCLVAWVGSARKRFMFLNLKRYLSRRKELDRQKRKRYGWIESVWCFMRTNWRIPVEVDTYWREKICWKERMCMGGGGVSEVQWGKEESTKKGAA